MPDRREADAGPTARSVSQGIPEGRGGLVIDQRRTVADVARKLASSSRPLGNWVRQERVDRGERDGLTSDEREKMARLRREVKRLTMECDLLKRSVAFWVKELDR